MKIGFFPLILLTFFYAQVVSADSYCDAEITKTARCQNKHKGPCPDTTKKMMACLNQFSTSCESQAKSLVSCRKKGNRPCPSTTQKLTSCVQSTLIKKDTPEVNTAAAAPPIPKPRITRAAVDAPAPAPAPEPVATPTVEPAPTAAPTSEPEVTVVKGVCEKPLVALVKCRVDKQNCTIASASLQSCILTFTTGCGDKVNKLVDCQVKNFGDGSSCPKGREEFNQCMKKNPTTIAGQPISGTIEKNNSNTPQEVVGGDSGETAVLSELDVEGEDKPTNLVDYFVEKGFKSTGSVNCNKKNKNSMTDINCMVCNCHYESRGETSKGRTAIGMVVISRMNKAKNSGKKRSACSIIYEGSERKSGSQFSWTISGGGKVNGDNYKRCYKNSVQSYKEMVGKHIWALNYHNTSVIPKWIKICTPLPDPPGGKIDNHVFYKDCDAEKAAREKGKKYNKESFTWQ